MAGTAVVCGFGITGIVGATGTGGTACAGLVGAGYGAETLGLVVAAVWLLWHQEQCQWAWHYIHVGVISCGSKQYHC